MREGRKEGLLTRKKDGWMDCARGENQYKRKCYKGKFVASSVSSAFRRVVEEGFYGGFTIFL